ncbi:MAG: hypothetical protein Q9183_004870 [Haloplaca sp. 2 TL-2023]
MSLLDLSTSAAVFDDEQDSPEKFEKPSLPNLPTELQLMILRDAMPDRVIPVLSSSDTKPLHPLKNMPQNLLALSKSIAAKARSVIDEDLYLVFDLDRDRWIFEDYDTYPERNEMEIDCEFFARGQLVDQLKHIRRMRRFEVVLGARQFQPWGFLVDERLNTGNVSEQRQLYKEKLRMICDALKTSVKEIRHLVFRLPCFCNLRVGEASLAEAALLDILEPLHRLTVTKPVSFVIYHDEWQCDHVQDSRKHEQRISSLHPSKTAQLEKTLQEKYSRLQGTPLSPQEEAWKSIKISNCPADVPDVVFPFNLSELWHKLDRDPEQFEAKARQYQEEKARSREEQGL